MSGKEPPRAPRALLYTLGSAAASSSSATASSSSATASTATPPTGPSRIGGVPPTGPRSLVSGHNPSYRGGRGKPYLNGHVAAPTAPANPIAPPTGPSARYSHKGKQAEGVWTAQNVSNESSQANEAGPSRLAVPTQVSLNVEIGGLTARTQAISFKLRPTSQPIPLKVEPQPPPQPSSEPPPPPPPTEEPPPPPPPPSSEPPPPPPPSSEPPPPPPSSEPPPPPPPPLYPPPSFSEQPSPPQSIPADSSHSQSSWVHPPPAPPSGPPPVPPPPPLEDESSARSTSRPPPPPALSDVPSPPPAPIRPKIYSLPPPPPWPPAPSEFPPGKNYKVLYDHAVDKDRDGQFRLLIEKLRQNGADQGEEPRVKGKGKGKEILLRYNGEVIPGEHEAIARDPRKDGKTRKPANLRPPRSEFVQVKYEYDANSTGPPPPTSVLVMGLSPLASHQNIRRHFSTHGSITSFEPQIDKVNGGALGIVLIGYTSHEIAKRCVEKEHGKKPTPATGLVAPGTECEEIRVVFDGEGKKLKAVLKQLDDRRRQEREEKRRREKLKESALRSTPSQTSQSGTPWRGGQPTPSHRQQANGSRPPQGPVKHPLPNGPAPHGIPEKPRLPPMSLIKARREAVSRDTGSTHADSGTPVHPRGRHAWRVSEARRGRSPTPMSRSPSPVLRRPGESSRNARQKEHEAVVDTLARNGFDHVSIDSHGAQLSGVVSEDDVRQFFDGFRVDKVLKGQSGWYVTFQTADSARRAALVLSSGARTLAHHSVTVTAHTAPARPSGPTQTHWDDNSLVEEAQKVILRDLRSLLEKDVTERVVASSVRRMVLDEKTKRSNKGAVRTDERVEGAQTGEIKSTWKGLSFRKQKRAREQETSLPSPMPTVLPAVDEREDFEVPERPKKRPKMAVKKVVRDDIESEDEDDATTPTLSVPEEVSAKRASSELSDDENARKKARTVDDAVLTAQAKKSKKATKKSTRAQDLQTIDEIVHAILPDDFEFDRPSLTKVRFTPEYESSLSPPASPVLAPQKPTVVLPPPDPIAEGICEDDEDVYYAKLALSRELDIALPPPPRAPSPDPTAPPPFRVHVSGAARSEGYYKISHAEKSAYVAQYASRTTVAEADVSQTAEPKPQPTVTSSRSNRANARRRVQGLEEINQVQLAMALSKGESAATELVKFNQLQTRKKQLRFAQSPIHAWGLYAMEKISRGEMVIEYVGEIIRAQVADKREKAYERSGIGSSYLFRIDEDLVVDATKIGNLGRLINHSCDPNCTAKIITINGEKKIVIYAKQDIELGSEITYDYHFPIEQDKIPCLCGSEKCRGYLN